MLRDGTPLYQLQVLIYVPLLFSPEPFFWLYLVGTELDRSSLVLMASSHMPVLPLEVLKHLRRHGSLLGSSLAKSRPTFTCLVLGALHSLVTESHTTG